MKKFWLALLLLFTDLIGQVDPMQFAKIGYADYYWVQKMCAYNTTDGFCNYQPNSYYFPALKTLGLNYVVTMADADATLNSTYNDGIKIIDMNFRAFAYTGKPFSDANYRLSQFAYAGVTQPTIFPMKPVDLMLQIRQIQ